MEHRKDVYSPHFSRNNPAHIYEGIFWNYLVRGKLNAKPIKFKNKLKGFTQKMADSKGFIPGPKYNPKSLMGAYDEMGIGNVGFSTGKRMNLSKPLNDSPGPKY